MTNFILSTAVAIIVALASIFSTSSSEPSNKYQLSAEEQIEIYEQVMNDCVINK